MAPHQNGTLRYRTAYFHCLSTASMQLLSKAVVTFQLEFQRPSQSRSRVNSSAVLRYAYCGYLRWIDLRGGSNRGWNLRAALPALHALRQADVLQEHHRYVAPTTFSAPKRVSSWTFKQWRFFLKFNLKKIGYSDPLNMIFDSKNNKFSGWPRRYFG